MSDEMAVIVGFIAIILWTPILLALQSYVL